MQRILVFTPPEDHGRQAITLATELASRTGASITLLRVLEETAGWPHLHESMHADQAVRDLLQETATRELMALADLAREKSRRKIQVSIEVSWGVPWELIIELVHSQSFDLVVKPARGLGQGGRVFFGTTALHLFRRCPCPVWVVGNDGRLPTRTLIALDPSLDRTRRNMATRLLEWGTRIKEWSDVTLDVASAWHAPGADILKGKIDREDWDRYVRDARQRAETALETLVGESASSAAVNRIHLLEGPARDVIPEFAESGGFDLVVVGAVGRTGVAGELLGETAEMIVRAINCSALVVSPGRPTLNAGSVRGEGA